MFYVFVHAYYYPSGLSDLKDTFETLEEAREFAASRDDGSHWTEIATVNAAGRLVEVY